MIEPQNTDIPENISCDSLFEGELICYQPQKGYRFSIDAVLLANFVKVKQGDRILDLGTGSGIISMILMYRSLGRLCEVSGIEVQQSLSELAARNFQANSFEQLCRVIHGDVKQIDRLVKPESYTQIVCNPPFYLQNSGRTNKNPEEQIARHQILATLEDFLKAAAFAVKNGGTVSFIYPAEQVCDFFVLAKTNRLEVKKIQFVYSYPNKNTVARLVLIQCLKNGGAGTEILSPLYVYSEKNGGFSKEMQLLYQKNSELPSNGDN